MRMVRGRVLAACAALVGLSIAVGLASPCLAADAPPQVSLTFSVPEAQALVGALSKVNCGNDVQGFLVCQNAAALVAKMQAQLRTQLEGK